MSHSISSRRQCVLFFLLAGAAGCSSEEPTSRRIVTGTVDSALTVNLGTPSMVAQNLSGETFDGPIGSEGGFTLELPPGRTYRLFITNESAATSRILWPGGDAWATVPSAAPGDGPITLGTIRLMPGLAGAGTLDGPGGIGAGGTGAGSMAGGHNASAGPLLCTPPHQSVGQASAE